MSRAAQSLLTSNLQTTRASFLHKYDGISNQFYTIYNCGDTIDSFIFKFNRTINLREIESFEISTRNDILWSIPFILLLKLSKIHELSDFYYVVVNKDILKCFNDANK